MLLPLSMQLQTLITAVLSDSKNTLLFERSDLVLKNSLSPSLGKWTSGHGPSASFLPCNLASYKQVNVVYPNLSESPQSSTHFIWKPRETRQSSTTLKVEWSLDRKSNARQTYIFTSNTTDSALSNETNRERISHVESTQTCRIWGAVLNSPFGANDFGTLMQNERKATGFCVRGSRAYIDTSTHILERTNETRVHWTSKVFIQVYFRLFFGRFVGWSRCKQWFW
jgi:hypothetical protein